jgi:SAM-dependent methyltransferase
MGAGRKTGRKDLWATNVLPLAVGWLLYWAAMDECKDRRAEELTYQAERAKAIGGLRPTPDHIIEKFRHNKHWWVYPKEYVFRSLSKGLEGINGNRILDFGCGEGEISTELGRLGAWVTGIDISPELIEVAEKRAALDKVQDRVTFMVRDLEESPLPEGQFDALVCYAVLHHLDVRSAFPRLVSALRPGGLAIVFEPVIFSPSLQRIREKVPISKDGGPLDHPLTRDEVRFLTSALESVRIAPFDIFTRLRRLLPSTRLGPSLHLVLGALDRVLFTLCPPLSRFCSTVVVVGRKPAPTNTHLRNEKGNTG